jgi:hypothetical protein
MRLPLAYPHEERVSLSRGAHTVQAKADLYAGKVTMDDDPDDNSDDNDWASSPTATSERSSINFLTSKTNDVPPPLSLQPDITRGDTPQPSLPERGQQVHCSPSRHTASTPTGSSQTFSNFGAPSVQQLNSLLTRTSCMATASPLNSPMATSSKMEAKVPAFGVSSALGEGWNGGGAAGQCQLVVQSGDVPLVLKMCSAAGIQVLQVNMSAPTRPSAASSLLALHAHHQHQLHQQAHVKKESSSPGVHPLISCSSWTPTLSAKDLISGILPPPLPGGLLLPDHRASQCFPFSNGPVVGGGYVTGEGSSLSLHLSSPMRNNPSIGLSSIENTVMKQVSGISAAY